MTERWRLSDGVVSIRPPAAGDAARLVAGRDPEFHRFLGDGAAEPDPVACIVVGGEVVGWVDHDDDRTWLEPGEVNLGYNVFAEHRGRGYATRAVALLLRHLADSGSADVATLLIAPDNERSLALAERAGFVRHGDLDGNAYWKLAVGHSRRVVDVGRIRRAALGDLDRLYEICVRTADAGDDATPLHGDPTLPGHVWAAPYLLHEPRHAFVVVDDDDVAGGYVIGALDSRRFEATLEEDWWPDLRGRYPLDADATDRTEADQAAVRLIHAPPTAVDEIVRTHPSHLHIDLLPDFQGRGFGRALIDTLLASLADADSPGVHLGVSDRNRRAVGFYRAVGFRELGRSRHGIAFGRRLGTGREDR